MEKTNTATVDSGKHYRNKGRFAISGEDIERGYVEVQLDPYVLAPILGIADSAQLTVFKKAVRWGNSSSKNLRADLNDIICACKRKIELLDDEDKIDKAISSYMDKTRIMFVESAIETTIESTTPESTTNKISLHKFKKGDLVKLKSVEVYDGCIDKIRFESAQARLTGTTQRVECIFDNGVKLEGINAIFLENMLELVTNNCTNSESDYIDTGLGEDEGSNSLWHYGYIWE